MNQDVIKAISLIGVIVVMFIVVQSNALTSARFIPANQSPPTDPSQSPPEQAEEDLTPEALVLQICSACHGLARLDGQEIVTGRGTEEGFELFEGVSMVITPRDWAATVSRMRVANNCVMSDEQEQIVVEWLNEND